ncbi:MAG: hypothetical protein P8M12_02095 [Flavobacteriales bacterium]|nr:hypothetical protein [Flavobacteriales bacterium]
MSAKEDTIALLKDAIATQQERLLNEVLITLNVKEIPEETFQLILTKMKASNLELFKITKALESQEIIDFVLSNKIGE